MYTLEEIAATTGMPLATLLMYAEEGLLEEAKTGEEKAQFSEGAIHDAHLASSLLDSGLEVDEVRRCLESCRNGDPEQRAAFLARQIDRAHKHLAHWQHVLNGLRFSYWCSRQTMAGQEDPVLTMLPSALPGDVQEIYDQAFRFSPQVDRGKPETSWNPVVLPDPVLSERTGIDQDLLKQIRTFAKRQGIGLVILYGSRARGTHWRASDIDLACLGGDVRAFTVDLDELTRTLLKYDVVDLERLKNPYLIKDIAADGVRIYEKI